MAPLCTSGAAHLLARRHQVMDQPPAFEAAGQRRYSPARGHAQLRRQQRHVLQPPFPRKHQPRGQGRCPRAGAGLTLHKVMAFHGGGDEQVLGHPADTRVTWDGHIPL